LNDSQGEESHSAATKAAENPPPPDSWHTRMDGIHLSFASPIKDMVETLLFQFNIDPSMYDKEDPLPLPGEPSFRKLCQTLGTEWGRELISKEIWIEALRAKIRQQSPPQTPIFIDDLRFPDEAEMLRQEGFKIVYLYRGDQEDSHASESMISELPHDYVIANTKDVFHLKDRLIDLIRR